MSSATLNLDAMVQTVSRATPKLDRLAANERKKIAEDYMKGMAIRISERMGLALYETIEALQENRRKHKSVWIRYNLFEGAEALIFSPKPKAPIEKEVKELGQYAKIWSRYLSDKVRVNVSILDSDKPNTAQLRRDGFNQIRIA